EFRRVLFRSSTVGIRPLRAWANLVAPVTLSNQALTHGRNDSGARLALKPGGARERLIALGRRRLRRTYRRAGRGLVDVALAALQPRVSGDDALRELR